MWHAWGHKLQRFRLELPFYLFPILRCEVTFAWKNDIPSLRSGADLSHISTRRICSREQRRKQLDWLATNTYDITSQSHSHFSCSREQIRQVENRLYTLKHLSLFSGDGSWCSGDTFDLQQTVRARRRYKEGEVAWTWRRWLLRTTAQWFNEEIRWSARSGSKKRTQVALSFSM